MSHRAQGAHSAEPDLARQVADALGVSVSATAPLPGGSTGPVAQVTLSDGTRLMAKGYAGAGTTPDVEAAQLDLLRETGAVPVPGVVHADAALLVLDWIDGAPAKAWTDGAAADLGARLAVLHRHTGPACGYTDQTWIGQVPQPNPWVLSWPVFFAEQRLRPLVVRCRLAGRLPAALADRVLRLVETLPGRLAPAPPALLHGDLWPGNILVRGDRVVGLVDPALHYGHPALDLATPGAYGPVPNTLATAYGAAGGIWPDEETLAVHRLWPLLVNLAYWDAGYAVPIAQTLDDLGA